MDTQLILDYFVKYGMFFLFIIVYLEYLNLPGLPAGIIMPVAGMLVAQSEMNFIYALLVSILAGMLGSYTLYGIAYFLGMTIPTKFYDKHPKVKKAMDKTYHYVNHYGNRGMFLCRLIPVARTLVSFVAGILKIHWFQFSLYSFLGITIWNFLFIFAGYLAGDTLLSIIK